MIRSATALAASLALLAAGCGSDSDEPQSPAAEGIELEVTLDVDGPGGEPAQSETVSCEPGSDCSQVVEQLTPTDFKPVPQQAACTKIYGGPDTATISGTLGSEPVETELNRNGGCEIERFARFEPLLTSLFPDYEPGFPRKP